MAMTILYVLNAINMEAYVAQNQLAKDLFREYKIKTDNKVHQYTKLKTYFPSNSFPNQAAGTWRTMMLMLIWGTVATQLSGGKVDYLRKWRADK